jgi:hypothetical protein
LSHISRGSTLPDLTFSVFRVAIMPVCRPLEMEHHS